MQNSFIVPQTALIEAADSLIFATFLSFKRF